VILGEPRSLSLLQFSPLQNEDTDRMACEMEFRLPLAQCLLFCHVFSVNPFGNSQKWQLNFAALKQVKGERGEA
jgi:hypothetical protein